jgi:hypothetical protein
MRRLRRAIAPAGLGLLLAVLGPLGLAIALPGCATSSAQPPPMSQSLVRGDRMSEAEAELVIARAITAHEMRRP